MSEQSALEKLQAELEALRAQVMRQEAEIDRLKTAPASTSGKKVTSRRKLLAQLGVAAAGVATLGALNNVPTANAVNGVFDSAVTGTPAVSATHTASGIAVSATTNATGAAQAAVVAANTGGGYAVLASISTGSSGSGTAIVANNSIGGTAISANATGTVLSTSVGVNARGRFTGVAARSTDINNVAYGLEAIADGPFGRAVYAHTSAPSGLSYGVYSETSSVDAPSLYAVNNASGGTESHGIKGEINTSGGFGVYASCLTTAGYALGASGGKAQLFLKPDGNAANVNPPTSNDHSIGEFYVANDGGLYYCLNGGNNPTWQKLAPSPAGASVLAAPVRVVETTTIGYGASTPSGANGTLKTISLNNIQGLTVPTGAKVFGTVSVYPDADKHMKIRPGLGKLTVWKNGAAFPSTVSHLTFAVGGIASAFFFVEISATTNRDFNLACNVNTTFAVDIMGYFG